MIVYLIGVYIAIVGLITLTVFQGHKCVRNINCRWHVFDCCPL